MNDSQPQSHGQQAMSRRDRIDRASDEFEQQFKAGEQPRIEDFLDLADPADRELLLAELLRVELELRHAAGEQVRPEEYQGRFSEAETVVESALESFDERRGSGSGFTGDPRESVSSTREASSSEDAIPEAIGRFRPLKILGQGAFGVVYLARDPKLNRMVALKVPRLERFESDAAIESFIREAQDAAQLEHRGIVQVHDVQHEPGLVYIVQQYVNGGNLLEYVQQGPLTPRRTAELLIAVAEAVGYAHKRQFVHRDLKPANILMDTDGKPYVADFGLAVHDTTKWQHVGEYAGSPAYMSPEQMRGESHRLDGRSDIWSLGVIFYELLAGRRPFQGQTRQALREQILHSDPPPPRQAAPETPAELSRICLACLTKRATDRYQSTADLIDDLRHWLDEQSAVGKACEAPSAPADDEQPAKVIPQGLRSFGPEHADFYLQLLEGPHDREGLPHSVRFWKTHIEQTDPDETFSVGVLYGPSGCGKSSLMKAGVLPRLDKDDVLPIYVEATAADTEVRLLKALRKRCPELPADASLVDLTARLRSQGGLRGRKVLIVLDQFEQWLHAHEARNDSQLLPALRQCDGAGVQCIVMVRDDFWMSLTRFLKALEVPLLDGHNAAAVDLFHTDHARNVLLAFGRAYGKLPESPTEPSADQQRFIQEAVDGLAEDGNVICVRLAVFAEMMKGRPWTPGSLKDVGGAAGVGVTFLEETFSAKAAPMARRQHGKAVRAVLTAMLPEQGADIKAEMQSHATLLEASGYRQRPEDFDSLLRILDSELRLVTPTEPDGAAEVDEGATAVGRRRHYQLTHDFLVPSLRQWLTRKQKETRRGRAELRLADRSAAWNVHRENRYLPALWEYCNIGLFTSRAKWTEAERNMMRAARKVHSVRSGVGLLLFFAARMLMSWWLGKVEDSQIAEKIETLRSSRGIAVQALIEDLRRFRLPAVQSQLHTAFDETTQDFEKLPLAFAIAELDHDAFNQSASAPLVDYLLKQVPEASPEDVDNFALALDSSSGVASRCIQAAADACTEREDWTVKTRLAALALYLDDASIADEMLRSGPDACGEPFDPIQRTKFIAEFPDWSGQVEKLANVLADTESPHLRSGISLALGGIHRPSPRAKAGWKDVLANWYQDKPDSGTHSASGWILKTWGQSLPATVTERPVKGRTWWDTECGVTMLEIPKGQVTSGQHGLLQFPRPFWISMHEISIALFSRFMAEAVPDKRPDDWQGAHDFDATIDDQHPIQQVSYEDAAFFCNWLSEQCGFDPYYSITRLETRMKVRDQVIEKYTIEPIPEADGFRLPTADEWEYACRATTTTAWSCGAMEDRLGAYAVYNASQPMACGSRICNPWGLFDMHGNVWEWCDTKEGSGRVCCGGGWYYSAGLCQSSSRNASLPTYRGSDRGFRVARGPLEPQGATAPKADAQSRADAAGRQRSRDNWRSSIPHQRRDGGRLSGTARCCPSGRHQTEQSDGRIGPSIGPGPATGLVLHRSIAMCFFSELAGLKALSFERN